MEFQADACVITLGFDSKQIHPKLYDSVRRIECHHVKYNSMRDEVFANFKQSHRSSICKPPNAVTWVYSLQRLQAETGVGDVSEIVQTWNRDASKATQLSGSKAMSVKHLLQLMPKSAREELKQTNSRGPKKTCGRENY